MGTLLTFMQLMMQNQQNQMQMFMEMNNKRSGER